MNSTVFVAPDCACLPFTGILCAILLSGMGPDGRHHCGTSEKHPSARSLPCSHQETRRFCLQRNPPESLKWQINSNSRPREIVQCRLFYAAPVNLGDLTGCGSGESGGRAPPLVAEAVSCSQLSTLSCWFGCLPISCPQFKSSNLTAPAAPYMYCMYAHRGDAANMLPCRHYRAECGV